MARKYKLIILIFLIHIYSFLLAAPIIGEYKTCFTPPTKCSSVIIDEINKANNSIYVQAYGFTNKLIISALIKAKQRGVRVHVILDKSNFTERYKNNLDQLNKAGIIVSKDKVSGIAHNKVMIIDHKIVITGSFNFTNNADTRNAENVIVLTNENIAHDYYQNWISRRNYKQMIENIVNEEN